MRVRVGEVRLYVEILGAKLVADGWQWRSRPTLLLIHGGPGFDHLAFRQAGSGYDDLDRAAQLVLVDLRGCGASDASAPEHWNLSRWAADLADLCDVLGLDRPVVVGESGGGWVALELLRLAPQLPAAVILANTSARWSIDRVTDAFRRRGGDEAATVARSFWTDPLGPAGADYPRVCMPLYRASGGIGAANDEPPSSPAPRDTAAAPARLRYNHLLLAHFAAQELHTFDHIDVVAEAECPILVIAGDLDPICPVEDADDIAGAARNVTYHRVEGAGHTVAHDQPAVFRNAVVDFLHGLAG